MAFIRLGKSRYRNWAETNPISSVVYPNKLIIGSNPPFVPRKGCVPQNLLLLVPFFWVVFGLGQTSVPTNMSWLSAAKKFPPFLDE